jgi:hypothetical protein
VRTDEAVEARRRRFDSGWPYKSIVILGEDVEHERARTFISRVVDDTAVVTICDLWGRRVCARSIGRCRLHDALELHMAARRVKIGPPSSTEKI